MVQRRARDDRVEGTAHVVLLELGAHERVSIRRVGVDADDVVPGQLQRRHEPTQRTAPDLQHARRRWRQMLAYEGKCGRQPALVHLLVAVVRHRLPSGGIDP